MPARRSDKPLAAYRAKRDFDVTPEPSGKATAARGERLRFVVQKHAARRLHYDLRLELDGVLLSWAIPKGPSLDPTQKPLAVAVEDHPLEYIDFEGVIPEGEYGGGTVMLWDRGTWEPIGDPHAGLEKGDLKFSLHGRKLGGNWALARMKTADGERNWLLIKKKDGMSRSVRSFNVLAELPCSVASGRAMEEIGTSPERVWRDGGERPVEGAVHDHRSVVDVAAIAGNRTGVMPASLPPQLATSSAAAPEGEDWIHEIKLDGYRLIARIEMDDVRLLTRNGHDWTDRMPAVADAVRRLPVREAFVDGEVVVYDEGGISDFQRLQNAFRAGRDAPLVFVLFDLPFLDGHDLRRARLLDRKTALATLLAAAPLAGPTLQLSDHIVGRGGVVFAEAAASGLEGIVSKRADARYVSKRTDSWRKIKAVRRESFVVVGYTDPSGTRNGFGALLLAQHDPAGRLCYRGRVGTGFSDHSLRNLHELLKTHASTRPTLSDPERDPEHRMIHWVEPALVVDVEFSGWTNDRFVRHPSFKGVREDIEHLQVVTETAPAESKSGQPAPAVVEPRRSPADATVAGVRISNPGRTVYPEDGVSKVEVARYYEAVAEWVLPHLVDRPLSIVRCPLGLAGDAFYQRQLGEGFPEAIRGIDVGDPDADGPAIMIGDLDGLIGLVQMGVLEIHPWGARAGRLEKPDTMILDLDPGPDITWPDIVASARFIRTYLDDLGLESFVKTSGGKGIHIVIPILPRAGWDDVKIFAGAIARNVVAMAPRNFVATMSKSRRERRIFIDYFRNHRGSTSVGVLSTRARTGATVSTPRSWDTLSEQEPPTAFTVRSVPALLLETDVDPWAGYHDVRQSITAKMRKTVGLPM